MKKISIAIFTLLLLLTPTVQMMAIQSDSERFKPELPNGSTIKSTFPDPNLAEPIQIILRKETVDDKISQEELDEIIDLFINYREVKILEGLQFVRNLEYLDARGNRISDISPLAGLTKLKGLWLESNDIADISVLKNLTNLEHQLTLNNNKISDISPLAGLTKLISLVLDNNYIRDISPVLDMGLYSLEATNQSFSHEEIEYNKTLKIDLNNVLNLKGLEDISYTITSEGRLPEGVSTIFDEETKVLTFMDLPKVDSVQYTFDLRSDNSDNYIVFSGIVSQPLRD